MYSAAVQAGWRVCPLESLEALDSMEIGAGDVVHLGWTAPVTQVHDGSTNLAMQAVLRACEVLARAQSAGARLVWTVHNVLPHDRNVLIPELAMCHWLGNHADSVHIMAESTADLVRPFYSLDPQALVQIPHPSYAGVYPTLPSRAEARRTLGIAPDTKLAVTAGTIRPYKGIDRILGLNMLAHETNLHFAVLGHFPGGVSPYEVVNALGNRGTVISEYLSDSQLGMWLAAADICLCPYRDILNSGSIELAATFGLPVVTSDLPALQQYVGEGWIALVDFDDPHSVIAQIDLLLEADGARKAALHHAKLRAPEGVSTRFLEHCLLAK